LGRGGEKENKEGMKHAGYLTVFIEDMLRENNFTCADLDGVAVSMGPGSYTGLRIGVSTAKGICYGGGMPLISISTLQSITKTLQNTYDISSKVKKLEETYFCPMIDARRMEVYTALYNFKTELIREISADVIDEKSFGEELLKREIIFFGDGAKKCKNVIKNTNAIFFDSVDATAVGMIEMAEEKFNNNDLEDVAYFEPFYLKDFVATTPKKNIFK